MEPTSDARRDHAGTPRLVLQTHIDSLSVHSVLAVELIDPNDAPPNLNLVERGGFVAAAEVRLVVVEDEVWDIRAYLQADLRLVGVDHLYPTIEPTQLRILLRGHVRRQALEEMDVLEQIAAAAGSDQPPEAMIELIVEKSLECLSVEQAAVHLLDEGAGERPLRTLMRRTGTRAGSTSYALGSQLSGWMLKHSQPLRTNDARLHLA